MHAGTLRTRLQGSPFSSPNFGPWPGREQTVGTSLLAERDHLLPLLEGFDLTQVCFPTVNGFSCVKGADQRYSVPLAAGLQVQEKVLEISQRLKCRSRDR